MHETGTQGKDEVFVCLWVGVCVGVCARKKYTYIFVHGRQHLYKYVFVGVGCRGGEVYIDSTRFTTTKGI